MDDHQYLSGLFRRYLDGQCSPGELDNLLMRFNVGENEEELRNEIRRYLETFAGQENEHLKSLADQALLNISQHIADEKTERPVKRPSFFTKGWISAAAAVLITAGVWGYFSGGRDKDKNSMAINPVSVDEVITPGGEKAILTLADGTIINMDSTATGELAMQGTTRLVKQDDGQLTYTASDKKSAEVLYNTMTTPRGGEYKLILPDGTRVWLNAASSIRYPTAFTGGERKVDITGEAYFEVTHNRAAPFRVFCGEMEIVVLGTHFNVNTYKDEDRVSATLLEGSVKINYRDEHGNATAILNPGDQACLVTNGTGGITINKDVDVDEITAWKNGTFVFNGSNIAQVMRQISRWYDVDIVYEGPVTAETFSGIVSRNSDISQVIRVMQEGGAAFKIEGRKIIVKQK